MKVGVFSDVHANWEALTACLKRLKKEGAQAYICCGDLIGYGPNPEECVQKIKELPLLACVMGNHDAVFVQPELESFFNYGAKIALDHNKRELSENSVRYLTSLPAEVQKNNFTAVHGTPSDPIKEYFSSCAQFRSNYKLWTGDVCFVGHTHLPFYMKGDEKKCGVYINKNDDVTVRLPADVRYIINPGAVGKPRDHNPAASFGLWDTEARTFRFLRESYDVSVTLEKMSALNYPTFLIDSLAVGL
uniref:Serine/threonine protein phosphatase n=1 Tax=uncultured Elusimicrobia bacterium TaxID=699876 RepID=A0A650EM65_9BACT|nr:serine/threonine protein phosphatase [uncultured Elusimicrobia bacterium]